MTHRPCVATPAVGVLFIHSGIASRDRHDCSKPFRVEPADLRSTSGSGENHGSGARVGFYRSHDGRVAGRSEHACQRRRWSAIGRDASMNASSIGRCRPAGWLSRRLPNAYANSEQPAVANVSARVLLAPMTDEWDIVYRSALRSCGQSIACWRCRTVSREAKNLRVSKANRATLSE